MWASEQCRERWHRTLRDARSSSAALSVAIHALRVHCAAFGVLTPSSTSGKAKSKLVEERDIYYHAAAFVEASKKAKRRRRN